MYDPSKDNSFDTLKNDLTQHSHGGITLHVIYITGVETKEQQLKIVERILKAIKKARSMSSDNNNYYKLALYSFCGLL